MKGGEDDVIHHVGMVERQQTECCICPPKVAEGWHVIGRKKYVALRGKPVMMTALWLTVDCTTETVNYMKNYAPQDDFLLSDLHC